MTNEQIVKVIKSGIGTAENMAQLYDQTKAFIHAIAWRYRHYAEQEGYLGLYDAIDGYDPAAGCLFLTYAKHWIKRRIVRYIQSSGTVRLPVHEWEKMHQYKKLENAFLSQIGRKPAEWEIQRYLGLTHKQVEQLKKAARMGQIESLDGYVNDEEDITLGELVPGTDDVESAVLDDVEQEELRATLWGMVDGLPGDQPAVIRFRYQQGMTLRETGSRIGITASEARNMENKAVRQLRRQGYRLRAFLPEAMESAAYHGSVASFERTWTSSTEQVAMRL